MATAGADTTHISGVGQIAINVHDMDRAVAFYRDTLGLPFLFQAGPNLAFFDCGGVRLMLDIAEDKKFDHVGSVLYYSVADLDGAHESLVAKGARVHTGPHLVAKMPDHELWMAFYYDPDENIFALMSERRE